MSWTGLRPFVALSPQQRVLQLHQPPVFRLPFFIYASFSPSLIIYLPPPPPKTCTNASTPPLHTGQASFCPPPVLFFALSAAAHATQNE